MAVTYQIDRANRIIRTRCQGDVTLEEVINHFRALEQDTDCPNYLDVLLDVSENTSLPKKGNLWDVTREIGRVRGRVQFGACALVARTAVRFGMHRMFGVFSEQYFRESRVFRTVIEAEEWLKSQRPTDFTAG